VSPHHGAPPGAREIRPVLDSLQALNYIISDVSRVVLMVFFWIFAFETSRPPNGPVIRRFSQFITALALTFTWLAFVYFDRRFDIVDFVDLGALSVGLNWFWWTYVAIALARLWLALRGDAGGYMR